MRARRERRGASREKESPRDTGEDAVQGQSPQRTVPVPFQRFLSSTLCLCMCVHTCVYFRVRVHVWAGAARELCSLILGFLFGLNKLGLVPVHFSPEAMPHTWSISFTLPPRRRSGAEETSRPKHKCLILFSAAFPSVAGTLAVLAAPSTLLRPSSTEVLPGAPPVSAEWNKAGKEPDPLSGTQ